MPAPFGAAIATMECRMRLDFEDARRFHEAIRQVLLHEWDPIGVRNCPQAQDEYDSYISDVTRLLICHEPPEKLRDLLWRIETEHMCLQGNWQHTQKIACRLVEVATELLPN